MCFILDIEFINKRSGNNVEEYLLFHIVGNGIGNDEVTFPIFCQYLINKPASIIQH